MSLNLVVDFEALSASNSFLYPVLVAASNLLGVTRINLIWLLALVIALALALTADSVLEMRSSDARQPFSPRALAQDALLFYFQLLLGRAVPYALVIVSSAAEVAPALARVLREHVPLAATGQWPLELKQLTFFSVLFVSQDLARYWAHRLQHKIGWIWELHKFHHSALALNVFTVTREHPLVIMMNSAFVGGATIIGATLVLTLFPELDNTPFEVAGGILSFVFIKTIQLLGHYHRPISLGPLDRWIVTPAVHAIHHSDDPAHHDRNFGSSLALWDRCFGSYVQPERRLLAKLRTGIDADSRLAVAPLFPLRYLYGTLTLAGLRRLGSSLLRVLSPRAGT